MRLTDYSLTEMAQLIRAGKVSSVEVTRACLDAIAVLQPQLNCYISIERDDALAMAKRADEERAHGRYRGPLHGVPLAHKDMFYRAGKVSTGGSKILRNQVQRHTATVLKRLRDAGAVYLGSLNMSEFAANPTGHNVHYGDCRNPWNVAHITGGSSSGSAAAVGARTCYAALGSDTGGSVRVPAAMCGVCGLKPTYGRISRAHIMPRAWSIDTVGIIARTVEDCAVVAQVVAGPDPRDATTSALPVPDYSALLQESPPNIKLGVANDPALPALDADMQDALVESIRQFGDTGAEVVELRLPDFTQFAVVADAITKCEAAAIHERWMRTNFADYSVFVRSRLEAGFHIPAAQYAQALATRGRALAHFVDQVFGSVDVLLLPTLPFSVPTIAETDINVPKQVPALISKITTYTRPINYLGLPAISVPCGFSASGLPIGFQLVGRPYSESLLLQVAHAYQVVTDWHRRIPPIVNERSNVLLQ